MADCYGLDKDDLPSDAFLITYQLINRKQNHDKTLLATIKNGAKNYSFKEFHGGGRSSQLLCYKDRIVIPKGLQIRVMQWYHHTLCHPGINQTKETISQHFYWKNMRVAHLNFILRPAQANIFFTLEKRSRINALIMYLLFIWKNMRDHITCISTCSVCQKQKKQCKKYGLLPEKEVEYKPWEQLCLNLIGPYKI